MILPQCRHACLGDDCERRLSAALTTIGNAFTILLLPLWIPKENYLVQNLRVPGPPPCTPETLGERSRQMINHRGPEFDETQHRIMSRLKTFFRTSNEVYVYTTSGTGAMEAAIVNMLSPADKVLSISIGEFGARFGELAAAYGANGTREHFDPGT